MLVGEVEKGRPEGGGGVERSEGEPTLEQRNAVKYFP